VLGERDDRSKLTNFHLITCGYRFTEYVSLDE
jgi:hypothetical protein